MRIALVAVSLLGVLLLGAGALILRDRAASRRRFEALFRRPARPSKPPASDHYYRPYWS